MTRRIFLELPKSNDYDLKITLVKKKKKTQSIDKIRFDEQPNGRVYYGSKSYEFNGEKIYTAIKYLSNQTKLSATFADFLQDVYSETPPVNRPKAAKLDAQEKVKTLNRVLKRERFPGLIRIKNNVIYLDLEKS